LILSISRKPVNFYRAPWINILLSSISLIRVSVFGTAFLLLGLMAERTRFTSQVGCGATLPNDKANYEKVSVTADYTKGGLNFNKKDVDTFVLGFGILY